MKIARRLGLGLSLGVLLLMSTSAVSGAAAAPAKKAAAPSRTVEKVPLCADINPTCGRACKNIPFELTSCWTTPYGPAKADVIVVPAGAVPAAATSSPNMLSCQGGGYALCFFSGPPTGLFGGQPLPCRLRPGGLVADCTCQYYSSGTYYVDINGILNQGAYFQAMGDCTPSGCACQNITGKSCVSDPRQATVCSYVNNQSQGNAGSSFYPVQAVSTFSFKMSPPNGNYKLATQPPTCHGKYAGCMTAACNFADGSPASSHSDGDAIQCECPVYDGDYQVGADGQACAIPPDANYTYVWSAANTVVLTSSTTKK